MKRAAKIVVRLLIASSLFALVSPSPAQSAPQPETCRAATHAISA